ncbi:Transmembrane protein [Nocardioides zeicaulis]
MPLVSWTVTVSILLTWVWRMSWPQDRAGTERLAEQERTTRSTDVWLIAAAAASLAVVVVALVQSSGHRDATAVASVILSVLSVALSWALVNTVYAFKYARMYYVDEPDLGGIDFKQDDPPTYSDFAYMAFTIGMAFGVSETEPTATHVRRVALGHALLSYAFGTGVMAVAINLVTNLGQ